MDSTITKTLTEALEHRYSDVTNIRVDADGRVTCHVDPMPNTNEAGEIFVGRVDEIIEEWERG